MLAATTKRNFYFCNKACVLIISTSLSHKYFKFLNPYISFLTSYREVICSSLFFNTEPIMLQFQYLPGLAKSRKRILIFLYNPRIATHDFSFLVTQMKKCPVHHLEVLKGSLNPLAPEFGAHCILHWTRI